MMEQIKYLTFQQGGMERKRRLAPVRNDRFLWFANDEDRPGSVIGPSRRSDIQTSASPPVNGRSIGEDECCPRCGHSHLSMLTFSNDGVPEI
jgi:hypothetical protein